MAIHLSIMDDKMKPEDELLLYPKCEKARETGILELAVSKMTEIPQLVFNIMSQTEVKECDLSRNLLSDIPSKLPLEFDGLTKLNLSRNFLGILPMEIGNLRALETLDLSSNLFYEMPKVVFKLPQLVSLYLQSNYISDFDLSQKIESERLSLFDLSYNPMDKTLCAELVKTYTNICFILERDYD